jgi:hypothetical protein
MLLSMFVASFIIQYFIMSFIMSNNVANFSFSLGKFYISVIMGLLMVIYEIGVHNITSKRLLKYLFLLGVFIVLYRNQVFISDNQYLKEMIEHHSMALLTSSSKRQSDRADIADLANNIYNSQLQEITRMKNLIKQ